MALHRSVMTKLGMLTQLGVERSRTMKVNSVTGSLEPDTWRTSIARFYRGDSRAATLLFIQTTLAETENLLRVHTVMRDQASLDEIVAILPDVGASVTVLADTTYRADQATVEALRAATRVAQSLVRKYDGDGDELP